MFIQTHSKSRHFAALLAAGGFLLFAAPADAGQVTLKGITVNQVWARATAPMARNGAAYMTIKNTGPAADKLIGASVPIAKKAELHETRMDGDVMRMRQLKGGMAVPAGKMVMFKPGSYHVMLMGLKGPLKVGDSFPLTLQFEKAGALTITTMVMKGGPAMGSHDQMKHDGKMKMPKKAN